MVPVRIRLDASNNCVLGVAQFIEFESAKTKNIHWELVNIDSAAGRQFTFVRSTTAKDDGIGFTLDRDTDFENELPLIAGTKFRKRLRSSSALGRDTLYTYNINVEWKDGGSASPQPCTPPLGPAIINRN